MMLIVLLVAQSLLGSPSVAPACDGQVFGIAQNGGPVYRVRQDSGDRIAIDVMTGSEFEHRVLLESVELPPPGSLSLAFSNPVFAVPDGAVILSETQAIRVNLENGATTTISYTGEITPEAVFRRSQVGFWVARVQPVDRSGELIQWSHDRLYRAFRLFDTANEAAEIAYSDAAVSQLLFDPETGSPVYRIRIASDFATRILEVYDGEWRPVLQRQIGEASMTLFPLRGEGGDRRFLLGTFIRDASSISGAWWFPLVLDSAGEPVEPVWPVDEEYGFSGIGYDGVTESLIWLARPADEAPGFVHETADPGLAAALDALSSAFPDRPLMFIGRDTSRGLLIVSSVDDRGYIERTFLLSAHNRRFDRLTLCE